MGEVYKMNIAGCERELPICPLNEHMDIAGFVMFSDVEITERAAQALLDSGACVADQVRDWLERSGRMADPERRGEYRWYVSDSVESFHDLASIFLGREVTEPVEQVAIENY